MPFIYTPVGQAALTADGGSDGYVTVADATPFFPGARVWLRSSTVESKEFLITEIVGNKIGLREIRGMGRGHSYGRTPVDEFKAADGASISQEPQVVDVELSNVAKRVY